MSPNIDELAEHIAALDPASQTALLEKVTELNFQKGLAYLSQKYRERLAREGRLNQTVGEIMTQLEQVREEIAAHDAHH